MGDYCKVRCFYHRRGVSSPERQANWRKTERVKCLTTCCAVRVVCLGSQFVLATKKGAGNRVHTSMCEEQQLQVKTHWQWCKSKNLQKRRCWSPGRGSCDGADSFPTCLEKACFFTSGQAWRESGRAVLKVRLYYGCIILSAREVPRFSLYG